MLPNCKEIAELASENIDTPIKGSLWLKMKLHLMMCTVCRRYKKQMEITHETICELKHAESEEVKERIHKNVEANYKESIQSK